MTGGVDLKASGPPDARLLLSNSADNVAVVRQALSGVGEALGLEADLMADVKTAVSEACNNVVVHAYGGEPGPLELYLTVADSTLEIIVRDEGTGIQPRPPEPEGGVQGVGLSLIQALTDSVEVRGSASEGGTEVRMSFGRDVPFVVEDGPSANGDGTVSPPADADIVISVCSGPLLAPVLGHAVAMLAARSGFSIERLGDAQLVTDAIAAHAPDVIVGRHVHVAVAPADGRIDLRVAPLAPEGGERLVEESGVGGLSPVLRQLTDEIDVHQAGDVEELHLALAGQRS